MKKYQINSDQSRGERRFYWIEEWVEARIGFSGGWVGLKDKGCFSYNKKTVEKKLDELEAKKP